MIDRKMRRTDIWYVEVYLSRQVILLHLKKKKSKRNKSQPKNLNKPKKAAATTMTKKCCIW